MFKELSLKTAPTIILSDGELGFQRVLDDFKSAKLIRIITYNISPKNKALIDALHGADQDTDIKIITNIPSRFDRYYGLAPREKARIAIEQYRSLLNPKNFVAPIETRFNFTNHSKLISTENIAYIGSANYSSDSAQNMELGAILTDKEDIKKVHEEMFNAVSARSILDPGEETAELYLALRQHRDDLIELSENLEDITYEDSDINWNDAERTFAPTAGHLKLMDAIHDALSWTENLYDDILAGPGQHGVKTPAIRIGRIANGIKHTQRDSPLAKALGFSSDDFASNQLEANALEAYDENLEYYAQQAVEAAEDAKRDLFVNINEPMIQDLLSSMSDIIEDLGKLQDVLRDAVSDMNRIDNT